MKRGDALAPGGPERDGKAGGARDSPAAVNSGAPSENSVINAWPTPPHTFPFGQLITTIANLIPQARCINARPARGDIVLAALNTFASVSRN